MKNLVFSPAVVCVFFWSLVETVCVGQTAVVDQSRTSAMSDVPRWRDFNGMWHGTSPTKKYPEIRTQLFAASNWTSPANVSELNTGFDDGSPFVSYDGLTIFFYSYRAGGQGHSDLWQATRPSRSSPFGAPVHLGGGVNSEQHEAHPSLTADGLELFFMRSTAIWKEDDLYRTTRTATSEPFSTAVALSELNTSVAEAFPCISPDGLTLYFTSNRSGSSGDDIWFATRPDRASPFGTPQRLESVNSGDREIAFSIRAEGLTAYLARFTGDNCDIYETTRFSLAENFGTPMLIVALADSDYDGGPSVTADGTELYFFSRRAGGLGGMDIWRSRGVLTRVAVPWRLYR